MGAPLEKGPGAAAGALLISLRFARFTGETMFPPWAPFQFLCSRRDVSLLSPNKFGSATKS